MFEFIRTHQRLMQFVLLLLIFPSFVFFGLESYTRFRDTEQTVAKVAGHPITRQELENAQRQQMERLRQMFGNQIDPKMLDTPQARQGILDSLIAERAVASEAARNNLVATPSQIHAAVVANFPDLADPSLSRDEKVNRYKNYAAMQGLTIDGLEARIAQTIVMQNLNAAIQDTAIAPKTVASRLSDINDQEREVQEIAFKAADFVSQVKVTDEMLKEYYEKHPAQFEIPEQIKADYLVLDNQAVASQITVSDADVKSYYEQNAKRFTTEEQRRASHILIAAGNDKAAAKAKAEKILAQVRKNPADFARLAKENSQDTESAERGGDLGFFGKGTLAAKELEDAAYKLKEGEISDLVESPFGYHIVRVTGIKPAASKSLEEAKPEITAEIRKQLAAKKFTEMAETFSNSVYEQADSLKPAADKLNLKIQTAANITRKPNPAAGNAPYNNPKFLQALFSDEAVKNKHNTEAIEVAPGTMISGHVVEYKPVSKKPFDEVKDEVRARVVEIESQKLATKAGEARLAEVKAGKDGAGFGQAKLVSRVKNAGLAEPAFFAVMKADVSKLPAFVGAEVPGQGYSVFRINKVSQPAAPDAARRQGEQQQIANAIAQQETAAYIEALKKKAKTEILKPVDAPAQEQGR